MLIKRKVAKSDLRSDHIGRLVCLGADGFLVVFLRRRVVHEGVLMRVRRRHFGRVRALQEEALLLADLQYLVQFRVVNEKKVACVTDEGSTPRKLAPSAACSECEGGLAPLQGVQRTLLIVRLLPAC